MVIALSARSSKNLGGKEKSISCNAISRVVRACFILFCRSCWVYVLGLGWQFGIAVRVKLNGSTEQGSGVGLVPGGTDRTMAVHAVQHRALSGGEY